MVKMQAVYVGKKHCELVHTPSGAKIATDAPKDNQGLGECFSPTDLVGAALASCILTTMAISAEGHRIPFNNAKAEVEKIMATGPRRIKELKVRITLDASLSAEQREQLEKAANGCPVFFSLRPDLHSPVEFVYV